MVKKNKEFKKATSQYGFFNNKKFISWASIAYLGFVIYTYLRGELTWTIAIGALIVIILYYLFYFKFLKEQSSNFIREQIKQGKEPYLEPSITGLMWGIIFLLFSWEYFLKNSLLGFYAKAILLLGFFVLGTIIGYFLQKNNIKKYKEK